MPRQIAVVYVTRTGKTRAVAEAVWQAIGAERTDVLDLRETSIEAMLRYEFLVFGSPTYGMGDLDYRWQKFLHHLPAGTLAGRTVALFVLGDQVYHGDTFAGSLRAFSALVRKAGAALVGSWPDQGYQYIHAPARQADGTFPGLVVDEITQAAETPGRIANWVERLRAEPACRSAWT